MSTEDEEKRLLERMLPIQLGKLRANAHKKHWLRAGVSNAVITPEHILRSLRTPQLSLDNAVSLPVKRASYPPSHQVADRIHQLKKRNQ